MSENTEGTVSVVRQGTEPIEETQLRRNAWHQDKPKREAKRELRELDPLLPRAVEDVIEAIGIIETKLPRIVQNRLARKRELRAIASVT